MKVLKKLLLKNNAKGGGFLQGGLRRDSNKIQVNKQYKEEESYREDAEGVLFRFYLQSYRKKGRAFTEDTNKLLIQS